MSYFKHHVFFCCNQRAEGETCCNSLGATEAQTYAKDRIAQLKLKGKGNVVRRMFADIEADIYVMVDGDATYDAASAPLLIDKLNSESLDMVVGCRTEESTDNQNYRPGHRLGNAVLTQSVQKMFGGQFTDMLLDSVGAAIGVGLVALLARWRQLRHPARGQPGFPGGAAQHQSAAG